MPELPEVETIARGLAPQLEGRRIVSVELRTPSVVKGDPETFRASVTGRTVTRVWRRAKLLILDLEGDSQLLFHLKMTGRVWLSGAGDLPDKHTHLVFTLDDGRLLYFKDVRRFGYCRCLDTAALAAWDFYAGLGPEPLECAAQAFAERMKGRKARIKGLLLDQRVVAGLGNIYVDEALHRAGIHPMTRADALSDAQLKELHKAVQAVLTKAIALGGSTFRDFLNAEGRPGNYQDEFEAYGRAGEPCRRCSATLCACKVAGRTSTFCPVCQHKCS